MSKLLFDIETDGLYWDLTKVHSLVIKDPDSGEEGSFADQPGYAPIREGLEWLLEVDNLIGHNIISFDLPTLCKVYPRFKPMSWLGGGSPLYDTLLLSRLLYPELDVLDAKMITRKLLLPKFRGSHGLEAWGHRLNLQKGDYAKEMKAQGLDPWAEWNTSMQDYCELDVQVTEALWNALKERWTEEQDRSIELEHKFAEIIQKQHLYGFKFDVDAAKKLYVDLAGQRSDMDHELSTLFDPWYVKTKEMVPKRSNKSMGYVEGAPLCQIKVQTFNPASRQMIGDRLMKVYGWKPKDYTAGGQPTVNEDVLKDLPYEPAQQLAKRFMLEKRIGQIAEGKNGWLKLERLGRLHGSVNTIGAVTGRCTHSEPNMGQVPSVGAPYGEQCRALFGVPPNRLQVGADASGLELRCLAHYMAAYDGGEYARILLEGDIHTVNQEAAGLPTRNNAKTFIYAFLYGAGDEKIGSIVGKGATAGKKLKADFLKKTPALKRLRDAVQSKVANASGGAALLKGIDNRRLFVRSQHSALNTLLQSAGALLVKQATINLYMELTRRGFVWGRDWAMIAHVHDEFQLEVKKECAEEIAEVAVGAFQQAGLDFDWRCPLDGEAKIGNNWAECH